MPRKNLSDEEASEMYEDAIYYIHLAIQALQDRDINNSFIIDLYGTIEEMEKEKELYDENLRKEKVEEDIAREREYWNSVL